MSEFFRVPHTRTSGAPGGDHAGAPPEDPSPGGGAPALTYPARAAGSTRPTGSPTGLELVYVLLIRGNAHRRRRRRGCPYWAGACVERRRRRWRLDAARAQSPLPVARAAPPPSADETTVRAAARTAAGTKPTGSPATRYRTSPCPGRPAQASGQRGRLRRWIQHITITANRAWCLDRHVLQSGGRSPAIFRRYLPAGPVNGT